MAKKLNYITKLYENTVSDFIGNQNLWIDFLISSAMNYKYSFIEQVLIYAQKPNAIACAEMKTWNEKLDRWVNDGAKGIALITETDGCSYLKYVFDVSDTNNKFGKKFYLWGINKNYEPDIIEALHNKYFLSKETDDMLFAIQQTADILVEDNIQDYNINPRAGVYRDDLYNDYHKQFIKDCVAIVMVERCGYKLDGALNRSSMTYFALINDSDELASIGIAISEIAKMGISEIRQIIKKVQLNEINKIYTFDEKAEIGYSDNEGSKANDNYLQNREWISDSESDSATKEVTATDGQVRAYEIKLSEKEQESGLSIDVGERSAILPLDRDSGSGRNENQPNSNRIEANREYHGGYESNKSNEMGWLDEQFIVDRGGDSSKRTNLQLDFYVANSEYDKHIHYFITDELFNSLLAGIELNVSANDIKHFFSSQKDIDKRAEFLKNAFYNMPDIEVELDGAKFELKVFENGLYAVNRDYINERVTWYDPPHGRKCFQEWIDLTYHYDSMIMLHQLPGLFTEDEQKELIENKEYQADITFSQEFIDEVLCKGSNVKNGKFRIYEQFLKSFSQKENAEFLKREYGTGGSGAIRGSGIGQQTDSNGLKLSRDYVGDSNEKIYNWNYVAKRISELIKLDRYLNEKELLYYNHWLDNRDREVNFDENTFPHLAKSIVRFLEYYDPTEYRDEDLNNRLSVNIIEQQFNNNNPGDILDYLQDSIISADENGEMNITDKKTILDFITEIEQYFPKFKTLGTDNLPVLIDADTHKKLREEINETLLLDSDYEPEEYVYHLGDMVYLGADKYEILDITDDLIRYSDMDYNLFSNKELPKEEFERKLNETPGNEHLIKRSETIPIDNKIKTITQTNYELLSKFASEVLNGSHSYMKFEAGEGFMPLSVELIGHNRIALAHYFEQNGDLMADPDMEFVFSNKDKTLHARTYQLDSIGKYQNVDGIGEFNTKLEKQLNEFANMWLKNIIAQRYELTKEKEIDALEDSNDAYYYYPEEATVYQLYYNPDAEAGGQFVENVLNYYDIEEAGKLYSDAESFFDNLEGECKQYLIDLGDDDFEAYKDRFNNAPYVFKKRSLEAMESLLGLIKNREKEINPNTDDFSENKNEPMTLAKASTKIIGFKREEAQSEYNHIIDKEFELDNRKYSVDYVSDNEVYLLDLSSGLHVPIHRVEKLDYIEKLLAEKEIEASMPKMPRKSKVETLDIHPNIKNANRYNYKITDENLGIGSNKDKFNRNISAIEVLKMLEIEDRFATPEEQQVLCEYVGWGGLQEAFDQHNSSWKDEYNQLKTILSESEYKSAKESVLTSFYTPPLVSRVIYKAIEKMKFKNANILDPGCGIGNFMGILPDSLKQCKIYGIEKDIISGKIAQQLYQKNSIAIQGYEDVELPDSFFDVAIGNVPFGNFKVLDNRYNKNSFLIHDYFFAKTLDKIRPGGIIAFITSKGTMDKGDPSVRKYIAQRADLLGAIRLPDNTFKKNAGTETTADIIFLQKRESITDIEPNWVYTDFFSYDPDTKINNYFKEHPEMIMGDIVVSTTAFGHDIKCKHNDENTLENQLNIAIQNIHAEVKELDFDELDEAEALSIPATPDVKNFSYTTVDGKIYYRENSRLFPQELALTTANRISGMMELRDCIRLLIEMQTSDYPDYQITEQQLKLNDVYDTFVKKYGLINSRANNSAFSDDNSYFLLCSLEILNENGELARKADIFTKRTIKAHQEITTVNTANEALIVSLNQKGRVNLPYMQELCGLDMDRLLHDLKGTIFRVPEYGNPNNWVTEDEYLSGNIREKIIIAERFAAEDDEFKFNVEALKKVMPKDLEPSEISVRLGATWIPTDIVEGFIYYLLTPSSSIIEKVRVHYSDVASEWNITKKSLDMDNVKANSVYGTKRVNAYKIIEDSLNLRDTRIFDYEIDELGNKKAILNKQETAIAMAKQDQIKVAFEDWIWDSAERRDRLKAIYNNNFNAIRPREYEGSNLVFNGINPEIVLRKHQQNAIARIIYGGNTLLAHEVGAGKTFEMVAAAMESKRLGLCNKSLFVVPNHIIDQFSSEFLQLYPSANILVSTRKDFETANRKKFCSRIATGEYDAVIIGHSQFEKIPMSVERQIQLINKQIVDISKGIEDMKANNCERYTIKQLQKSQKILEFKLEKLNNQRRKDYNVINFEELGVDRLFIDEAHYYKNLYLYTKMRNISGIAQTEAQKSSDLFMKCQYLDELTDNKGVIFATGTPISNSMVELYTMQRYLQFKTLLKHNLQHFDSWASTFGETLTAIELAPEGTGYRAKTRFAKFYNLPELMSMVKEFADIQTAEMLNLPVPKANYHTIVIPPSPIQKEMVKDLALRAEKVRSSGNDPKVDNMLKITNDGRKLALDQRLIDERLPDFENSKISSCANNIYEIWNKSSNERLTQLVFCDLSTPTSKKDFNVYDDLKIKLITKGIPKEEIAFIHDANTDLRKKEIFSKVRSGQIRILLGSTQKMGAGTNCQDRLIALHDLDCPWRPSDLTQRSGRIIRQGNKNSMVDIFRYVTESTFDAYLYQLVENKQRFISQIMTSKTPVRVAEDIDEVALSYAEIKALAAGNPLIIEKTELDTQVAKLKLLKQNHKSQIYDIEDKIAKYYPREIQKQEAYIEDLKIDVAKLNNNTNDTNKFQNMIINGVCYTEKAEAGKQILECCNAIIDTDPVAIGEYRGFKMSLKYFINFKNFSIYLENKLLHRVDLGDDVYGNITRIDNELAGISNKLIQHESDLQETIKQFEFAKTEVKRPFAQEDELKQKTKRLNKVNALLSLNQKDKELIDDEYEPISADKSDRDYER